MSDIAWISFLAATVLGFGFFFFTKRRFDFLTIAYIGAIFYFSPLFWGRVMQSSLDLKTTIQPAVYLIATAYVVALVLAGNISERFNRDAVPAQATRNLAGWYLVLALLGLLGALVSSKGAIINPNKVVALRHVGYLYILFEIAASLACIAAVIERRWWIVAGGAFLLVVDLLVGFRVFVVLTALSVAVVMLMRDGRIQLFTKTPIYGLAALLLVAGVLLSHSARYALFDNLSILQTISETVDTPKVDIPKMRSDILQYEIAIAPLRDPQGPPAPAAANEGASKLWEWAQIPFNLLQHSEPSIIQATLVGVVQRNLSCSPSNILKSLYLLVPPGFTGIIPNTFPPTFYDEYQPILYPNATNGGLGGNIWAEMLCRFGYAGVAIFGVLMITSLVWLYRVLRNASPALSAPIAFGGVIVAFYINRNDLHFTLVMLRQVAMVFILAFVLSAIVDRVQRARGFNRGLAS